MTMEKGVGDVHLVNRPAARHGELEHGVNGPGLDNRGEGLSKINVGSLTKAANDPSRLMPIKSSVRMELVLEDPLPSDDVGMARSRNKLPCLVALQGIELVLHGREPQRVTEGYSS
jgi:hypothetical protein